MKLPVNYILLLITLLVAFIGQPLASNVNALCLGDDHVEQISDIQNSDLVTLVDAPVEEECCNLDCCSSDCLCIGGTCSSVVYVPTTSIYTTPGFVETVLPYALSNINSPLIPLLYRPPIA